MKFIVLTAVIVTLILPLSFSAASGASFSNADLDRYRRPEDPAPSAGSPAKVIVPHHADRTRERDEREMERWCSKAEAQRKKIEHAKARVEDARAQMRPPDIYVTPKSEGRKSAYQKRLEKAEKDLQTAQKELDDLEQTAHRQGVPPGWLRCQY